MTIFRTVTQWAPGLVACRICEQLWPGDLAAQTCATRRITLYRSDDYQPASFAYACEEHADALATRMVLEAEARE